MKIVEIPKEKFDAVQKFPNIIIYLVFLNVI